MFPGINSSSLQGAVNMTLHVHGVWVMWIILWTIMNTHDTRITIKEQLCHKSMHCPHVACIHQESISLHSLCVWHHCPAFLQLCYSCPLQIFCYLPYDRVNIVNGPLKGSRQTYRNARFLANASDGIAHIKDFWSLDYQFLLIFLFFLMFFFFFLIYCRWHFPWKSASILLLFLALKTHQLTAACLVIKSMSCRFFVPYFIIVSYPGNVHNTGGKCPSLILYKTVETGCPQ